MQYFRSVKMLVWLTSYSLAISSILFTDVILLRILPNVTPSSSSAWSILLHWENVTGFIPNKYKM